MYAFNVKGSLEKRKRKRVRERERERRGRREQKRTGRGFVTST